MVENLNVITKEGLEELRTELKKLIEIERPKVIQDIKEARAQGDLSENAEFDAARERQGQIEDRIREIENIIENSTVSSRSQRDRDKVRIGSKVVVEFKNKNNEVAEYRIVGTLEVDPFNNLISNISPLGKAIIGKSVGDEVTYMINNNSDSDKIKVLIKNIDNN